MLQALEGTGFAEPSRSRNVGSVIVDQVRQLGAVGHV